MKPRGHSFASVAMFGSLVLLAPVLGWGACSKEAQQSYEKGTQVSQKYTAQGNPCQEECLEEKRYFYQRAVELCPSYPEADINLGDVLEQLGRYPEALIRYTKATELNPGFAIAYFGLGDFYFHTGDYAKAVAAYDKGLLLDPQSELANEQRRQALCLKDKEVPAARCIQEVLGGFVRMGPGGIKRDRRIPISIPFAYNADTLLPEARRPLQELGTALKGILESFPSAAFLIEGHTDLRGTDEYNLDLSTRRARRVAESLAAGFSLPPDRLGTKGYGKTRPISLGSSEADHARNRRVEVVRLEANELGAYPSIKPVGGPSLADPPSLVMDVGVFYEDAESRPRKLQDGARLHSGDGYRVFFEPQQPCYVYIFQLDTSGKLFHLYPNPKYGTHDNFAQARAAYWVPGKDKWFELDHTLGKEEIYVVATRERREDIEDLFKRLTRADPSDTHQTKQQVLTLVLKTVDTMEKMGVGGTRPGKNVTTASKAGQTAELTTDQLYQEGLSLARKVVFHHE
ncbi:MAG: OmpA family protein [Deltaproteobacteria bacterium]|nr:OmpA family protein [Deltaproteobacteria bacterium]